MWLLSQLKHLLQWNEGVSRAVVSYEAWPGKGSLPISCDCEQHSVSCWLLTRSHTQCLSIQLALCGSSQYRHLLHQSLQGRECPGKMGATVLYSISICLKSCISHHVCHIPPVRSKSQGSCPFSRDEHQELGIMKTTLGSILHKSNVFCLKFWLQTSCANDRTTGGQKPPQGIWQSGKMRRSWVLVDGTATLFGLLVMEIIASYCLSHSELSLLCFHSKEFLIIRT
jgi:hypothetical protein